MNKKRLSVVMAGAMLASSVAPVLAAEVTKDETTHGKMGLFIDKLEALMESKKYYIADPEAGKSVYRFAVLDSKGNEILNISNTSAKSYDLADGSKINVFSNVDLLKELDTTKEYTVKIYELGSVEKGGNLYSTDKAVEIPVTYNRTTFGELIDRINKANEDLSKDSELLTARLNGWITKLEVNSNETKVIITLGSKDAEGNFNKVECAVGTPVLKFAEPVDASGNAIKHLPKEQIQSLIAGFEAEVSNTTDIAGSKSTLLHEVKVLNGDMNYTVKVDDLYDGFMLTDKGHELMNAIKASKDEVFNPSGSTILSVGSERSFTVTFVDKNKTKHVVKVVGDSAHMTRIQTLKDWLVNEKAKVEKIVGTNRYATAVEIAKTYLVTKNDQNDSKYNDELVLINGRALVDGLAAAPYAKEKHAPILLTEKDGLPKETKAFMKELVSDYNIGSLDNKTITVTIVGGEAVVSQNVVNELKEIGFKVKRISGDNREETSLAVADKLYDSNYNRSKAFVVGAEGEADAMSIAAAAAKEGAPIIVAKSVKGLSTVGLNEVSEYENVEIVGGEGVVPASTETEIKELVDDEEKVTRINGKNRFETNALVIKKYHKGFEDVLIAKDGKRNKEELVDALPASLFASDVNGPAAPIVLATDKISDEQLNQLVLNSKKPESVHKTGTVYQIGEGVNPKTVMQVVVKKLGLNR